MALEDTVGSSGRGGTEHFLRLITPIQGRIFAYILSRQPNRADADDIMQETISTIWNKFDDYESGTDFQAWAITIAKYTTLRFRQKNTRNPIQFNDEAQKILQSKSEGFLNKIDSRLAALENCVKKLSEADRKQLDLRYFQGLPVKQIAKRFDVSTRAIYKALLRIHNTLMRCVRRSLAEEAIYE